MPVTIQEILTQISNSVSQLSQTPVLDAQVLVANFLEKPRSWVMAHPEAQLDDYQYNNIIQGLNRLKNGEPLPYVIGHWEFYGLDFYLTPDVLIPRPETELLVEHAINWLKDNVNRNSVLDVGTGSGCIGVSLAMNIPDIKIIMTDISQAALDVARRNVEKYGLSDRVELRQTDLLAGISRQFDLICANLPYIPSQMLKQLPVSKREPHLALDGGIHGTTLISRLLYQSRNCLSPGGLLLLEIEASDGAEVKSLVSTLFPAAQMEILKDLSGRDRCIKLRNAELLIHLCRLEEWRVAQEQGSYISPSISQEGFIHCSQPGQILEVANRFYQGIPGLVLLWIDPAKITADIRWEAADGDLFPHIYGHINLDAVMSVTDLNPDLDGIYRTLPLPD
jgi:release factor glutamine methyltransferase